MTKDPVDGAAPTSEGDAAVKNISPEDRVRSATYLEDEGAVTSVYGKNIYVLWDGQTRISGPYRPDQLLEIS